MIPGHTEQHGSLSPWGKPSHGQGLGATLGKGVPKGPALNTPGTVNRRPRHRRTVRPGIEPGRSRERRNPRKNPPPQGIGPHTERGMHTEPGNGHLTAHRDPLPGGPPAPRSDTR
ncbi:hypothetical protein GCM10018775_57970 [Streptomyces umbrinus]|nr:hypothetical protein GCM10018775_57970 [Streptomyces umbrinus]